MEHFTRSNPKPSNKTSKGKRRHDASRRDFLRVAAGGLTAGGALLVAGGCDSGGGGGGGEGPPPEPTTLQLDFSSPVDVLNYAYALEQLEAAFYARAVTAINEGDLDLNSDLEVAYLEDLAAHEAIHRDFLAYVIPEQPDAEEEDLLPDLSDFLDLEGAVDFGSRDSVLATAQLLEDIGVSAYNGAGIYLAGTPLLTIAGKIVSVEARHAAALRSIYSTSSTAFADLDLEVQGTGYALTDLGADSMFSLDALQDPTDVLDAVADTGLLVNLDIEVINADL